jgi:hypothetical protein
MDYQTLWLRMTILMDESRCKGTSDVVKLDDAHEQEASNVASFLLKAIIEVRK